MGTERLNKCINIVKAPLQMTHKKYVTVNYGTTRNAQENDIIEKLINGGVEGMQM